jgi:multisubunit Na+/H+ antiporter MnhB subunit
MIHGHVSPMVAFAALLLVGIVFGALVYAVMARRDRRTIARLLAEIDAMTTVQ